MYGIRYPFDCSTVLMYYLQDLLRSDFHKRFMVNIK